MERTFTPSHAVPAVQSLRTWWAAPDPALADAGAEGELVVARIRLGVALAIVGVPLSAAQSGGWSTENRIALACATVAVLIAGLVYWLAVRRKVAALGFFTSVTDVTIVSLVQAGYLLAGMPSLAANSRTAFPLYVLAIAVTALRWDVRVSLLAGVLAVAQYAAITATAWHFWNGRATPDTAVYGQIVPGQQGARLVILIAITAVSVAIVRQSSRLRISSTHDALTGLPNRSYFHERLDGELDRARRIGAPVAIAMLDIDRFKVVNDSWGHAAGDVVLVHVANVLRDAVRKSDLVARYGGEEFIIAMPQSSRADAGARIEQVLNRVRALEVRGVTRDAPIRVTVSAGIAVFDEHLNPVDEVLRIADDRLTRAKRDGRDRVVAAG